jgi:hypothetical protein
LILPSYFHPGGYSISGTINGSDIAEASIMIGTSGVRLEKTQGPFSIDITKPNGQEATDVVAVLKDVVGNTSIVPVAPLSFLDMDIVQPAQQGLISLIPKLLLFSNKFFISLWIFVFLALALNILIKVRVQRRATIMYSLLLLYGLSIMLITK